MASRREVVWSPAARRDLDEIVAYIAADSPAAGATFLEEVLDSAGALASLSERGRMVPEFGDPHVREIFLKRYRVLYEVQANEVHILGIIHGARDLGREVQDP